MRVVIVIPTFNERGNIGRLIEELQNQFSSIDHQMEILVVDDNSPDGTAELVRAQQLRWPNVHLLSGEKRGLGAAYIRGMRQAIDVLKADAIFEMDGDLSHKPADVPRLLSALEAGADIVIGSRYVPGGRIPREWPLHRRFISWLGNQLARHVTGIDRVHDCTAGFRAIRESVIRNVHQDRFRVRGYVFQVALLHAAIVDGAKVIEVPVEFVDRTVGESKLGIGDIIEFLVSAIWLRFQSAEVFARYCVVGMVGVAVNLSVFTGLLALGVSKFVASPMAILCAIVTNFLGNTFWTFRAWKLAGSVHLRSLVCDPAAVLSLIASYLTFVSLSYTYPRVAPQIQQLISIIPAAVLNYFRGFYWASWDLRRSVNH